MPVLFVRKRVARWRVRLAVACGASAPLVTVHPVCLAAQAAGGAVAGRVADTSGTPVPGAMVYLAGTRLGASTGDDGRYHIGGIPPGSYAVHVRRIGFSADSVTVAVVTGRTAVHDVDLRPVAAAIAGRANASRSAVGSSRRDHGRQDTNCRYGRGRDRRKPIKDTEVEIEATARPSRSRSSALSETAECGSQNAGFRPIFHPGQVDRVRRRYDETQRPGRDGRK
jgi:hypothetical protein